MASDHLDLRLDRQLANKVYEAIEALNCTETPTFAQLGDSQFYAPGASVLL